jgi:TRAP-type mannitol/chloroaromatic compound transport system permease large subunit
MKVVLKVLITLLGLASITIGFLLFKRNATLAVEVASLGNTMGLLPTETAFKNAALSAIIAALGSLVLVVVSFLKTPGTATVAAVVSMGLLAASYFLQPDYNASLISGELSRDIALNQLFAGVIASGLTLILSQQKDKPILRYA